MRNFFRDCLTRTLYFSPQHAQGDRKFIRYEMALITKNTYSVLTTFMIGISYGDLLIKSNHVTEMHSSKKQIKPLVRKRFKDANLRNHKITTKPLLWQT